MKVDDRFGWQLPYRGGTDVLDGGNEQYPEQRFEVFALQLTSGSPGGIGIDEVNGFGGPGWPRLLIAHGVTTGEFRWAITCS